MLHKLNNNETKLSAGAIEVATGFRTFSQLVEKNQHQAETTRTQVEHFIYFFAHVAWMALYLAEFGSKLSYKRVWQSGVVKKFMISVWCASLYMEKTQATRVQTKVERFFRTSPLIGTACFKIRIPTHRKKLIEAAHRVISRVLKHLRKVGLIDLATYIKHKVRVVQIRGPKLSDWCTSHIKVPKLFR